MEQIATVAKGKHRGPLLIEPLYSRIVWFHRHPVSQGDIDNIPKRIHDALKLIVFADDSAITHSLAVRMDLSLAVDIRLDPANPGAFQELSQMLTRPDLNHVLYIEIGSQPQQGIQLGPITP